MRNSGRDGTVLIAAVGTLAVFFLLGTVLMLVSSSAYRRVENNRYSIIARLGAVSALAVCSAVIDDFQEKHNCLQNGMMYESDGLSAQELEDFVVALHDIVPPFGKLGLLRASGRGSLYDLSNQSGAVLKYSAAVDCEDVNSFVYLKSDSADISGITLEPSAITGELTELPGKGRWRITAFGRGGALECESGSPLALVFSMSELELVFRCAAMRSADGEGFIVTVFFPEKKAMKSRRFVRGSQELFALPWE